MSSGNAPSLLAIPATLTDPRISPRTLCMEESDGKKRFVAYRGSSRVSRNTESSPRASVVSVDLLRCGYRPRACEFVSVCERGNNPSKLALGELKGNQLHTGGSRRFPVRSAELPGGIQYEQNNPVLLQRIQFHTDFN